jgi:hypothetical protein
VRFLVCWQLCERNKGVAVLELHQAMGLVVAAVKIETGGLPHYDTVWSGRFLDVSEEPNGKTIVLNWTALPTSNTVDKGRSTANTQLLYFVMLSGPACVIIIRY